MKYYIGALVLIVAAATFADVSVDTWAQRHSMKEPTGNTIEPGPLQRSNMVGAIITAAPAQHASEARFKKIDGSNISVLTGKTEFPFCRGIKCFTSNSAFRSFTGGVWNFIDWEYMHPAGGGATNYGGNELYLAKLEIDEVGDLHVKWSRPIDPQPLKFGNCGEPINGPLSSHTYAGVIHVESRKEYYHTTTGGYPGSRTACRGISKSKGMGGWVNDTTVWTKVSDIQTEYARACYHRNRDKIYVYQKSRSYEILEIDPADGYSYTARGKAYIPSVVKGFDAAMDQDRDICYYYANQVGLTGHRYDPITGARTLVFQSAEKTFDVSSLSIEHSTGNLVIANGGREVHHIEMPSGNKTDISGTAGDAMPTVNGDAQNIYGKFEMIEPIPCIGIGLGDARQGVYLMTLPASVCKMK